MDYFFQSFLATARAIAAIILEQKLVKVSYHKGEFTLSLVENWSKHDREESAKEFFAFYKKNLHSLDIPSLPMGERLAILEVTKVLEEYIETYLWNASLVKSMLISEIFAIKLGGTIPRKYTAGFTPDMHFIRQNGLADMFFAHGIALRFDPERGVGFPILTRKGDKIEVFFCDLKSYDLNIYKKFYHRGEYLFSTDEDKVMINSPRLLDDALSIDKSSTLFMTFKNGFPQESVEIYHRDQDVFVVLHDGEGRMYRVGVKDKKAIFPDQFAYTDEKGFHKIILPATTEMIRSCMQDLTCKSIKNVEAMMDVLATNLQFENECKHLSLLEIVQMVWNKQAPISAIFMPWTVKKVSFEKLVNKRGGASKI